MGLFSLFKRTKKASAEVQTNEKLEQSKASFDLPIKTEDAPVKAKVLKKTSVLLHSVYHGQFKAYDYTSVSVVGVQYAKPEFSSIDVAKKLDLVPEPENEHDKDAIRVEYKGIKLGYVPSGHMKDMFIDFAKRNELVVAMARLVDEENNKIEIEVAFYKGLDWLESNRSCVKAKLGKTNKKDCSGIPRYENLETVRDGDTVTLEYAPESETYVVYDDYKAEIGELSKIVSGKLLSSGDSDDEFIAIIDEVDEDESGKCTATIKIYFSK